MDSSSGRLEPKLQEIQMSFRNLDLQPKSERGPTTLQNVLLGKVIQARDFRRFVIWKVASKAWKVKSKIQVEKIDYNVFKFTFDSKSDRDYVWREHPWCLDGAHIVPKEWEATKSLDEIGFDFSTFSVQVHGLPLVYLHEETAEKIGKAIGQLHPESLSRRCVVRNRFLKLRVDIDIRKPLPAGTFLPRRDGDERWVQYKYERLPDMCYKCGCLDHVSGRCSFEFPATITTMNGVTAKLYGPWVRAEVDGGLLFVNIPDDEEERQRRSIKGKFLKLSLEKECDRVEEALS